MATNTTSADKMFEEIDLDRRRFFGTAAMIIAAAQFGMIGSARRTIRQDEAATARDQAGDEHVVRLAEADRCWRSEYRLRRSRPRRWSCGHSSARLALRHSHLRRRRAVAGIGGLPGDRAVSARLWHDALSLQ